MGGFTPATYFVLHSVFYLSLIPHPSSLKNPSSLKTDHLRDDLPGTHHAGQSSAGMRAGADEVKIGNIFAQVVRAEPRGLRQDRLDRKGATEVTVQRVAEVQRVDVVLGDDMLR